VADPMLEKTVSKTTESAEKLSFKPVLWLISSCLRQEKIIRSSETVAKRENIENRLIGIWSFKFLQR
jgi:hypothetical protein